MERTRNKGRQIKQIEDSLMYGKMDEKDVKFRQQQKMKKVYEQEYKDYHRMLHAVSFNLFNFTSIFYLTVE